MRRPLRKPHGLNTSDIENFETESKYIIYLDGTSYVAINGDTGTEDSRSTSAHTVIQYALDNGGAGVVSLKCDVALTANVHGVSNTILDGNYHTITPATSFDMVTMNTHFIIKNTVFDVSAIAFTHTCITFDGADSYVAGGVDQIQRAGVYNCDGISAASRGTFILYDCTVDGSDIGFTLVDYCTTKLFEYAYKIMATAGTAYVNGNYIRNVFGIADKYFLYMEEGATNATSHNHFSGMCQRMDETDTCFTIDGDENFFDINIFDLTAAETGIVFSASSSENFVFIPKIDIARITDAGTSNFVYCIDNHGFIGNSHIDFFEQTGGNPSIRLWGDVAGTEKYVGISISTTGHFTILGATASEFRFDPVSFLSLSRSANAAVRCFDNCGTDENVTFEVYGRNNADNARHNISAQWGNGTHEDGEIKTSSGDLRLSPSTGIVSFGTKTGTGDAVLDGYVTIKDAAGNTVKLATTA